LYNKFEKIYEKLVEDNIAPVEDVPTNLITIKTKLLAITSLFKNNKIDSSAKN
jgi:hypothetical protein